MGLPNRTKIVATLGPASMEEQTITEMARSGVDVFRLNCAHNDHKSLARAIRRVRKVARDERLGLGILADLQGPKIRVGPFADSQPIWLRSGDKLIISTEPGVVGSPPVEGEIARVGCGYRGLARDVKPRERILLDDGNIELRVVRVNGTEVLTKVVYGGLLKPYKGINLPFSKVSTKSLSKKDLGDLRCVLEHKVDFVAQSFVRSREDVELLRRHIEAAGADVSVIAKIERPEAVAEFDAILRVADGIMVARGDMGVEMGPEVVPAVQKKIIAQCLEVRKPVITATQMLESMVINPRPTRAEASDVANAIYDGTSAVMLSAETASGKHPVRSVRTMDKIIRRSEADIFSRWEYVRRRQARAPRSVTLATVRAAAYAALESDAAVIAVFTESGRTAQLLAGERIPTRIYAFTPFQHTVQRLSLTWGILARKVSRARTSHEMTLEGERILREQGLASTGDRVVVVSGTVRQTGLTNTVNIRVLE